MSFLLRLQAFLKAGTELPSLPASVLELQAALIAEEVALGELVGIVEKDPALTARLLRAANSALYSRGGDRVATLAPAIGRIGLRQLRSVALAGSILTLFKARSTSLRPEVFWAHSAAVGAAARVLASNAPGVDPEECYTAGLLHDVGLLVLDQFFPDDYALIGGQRLELELPWWQQEEDTFGLDHGEIGGLLLGHWGLPLPVVDAVTFHHRPQEAPADAHQGVIKVVHAAEMAVAATLARLVDEGLADDVAPLAVQDAGVPTDKVEAVLEKMGSAITESSGVFI
jgi:putative nucleotidyltransferase with HDIG domain